MLIIRRIFFPVIYLYLKLWKIKAKFIVYNIYYDSIDEYVNSIFDNKLEKIAREEKTPPHRPGIKRSRSFVLDDCEELKILDDLMPSDENTFKKKLLEFIYKAGMTNSEVYSRIDMDRRLFSKICSFNNGYMPSKKNILALSIGMKLTAEQAQELLEIVGYTFSKYSKTDIVVKYFLEKREYNIFKINEVLTHYNRTTL